MGRFLLFILIITFAAIVSPSPINKSKPDVYKLLTEMGYNPCQNASESKIDSCFESALEAFQKAYHLPVTKKLDSATLRLLNTSRCGMPDGPAEVADRSTLWYCFCLLLLLLELLLFIGQRIEH